MSGADDQVQPAGGADLLAAAGALDSEAARLDQAAPAAAGGAAAPGAALPGAPAAVDFAGDARDLIAFSAELFFPLWPRLAAVWTLEKREQLTLRLAPVLKKHNLSLERILGQWGAEIMFVAAVLPAVVPTVQAIRQDNQEAKENARSAHLAAKTPQPAQPAQRPPAPPPPAPGSLPAAPPDANKIHQEGKPEFAPPPTDTAQLHTRA